MGEFKVHRVRFYEYEPKAVNCLVCHDAKRKVALSREDGSIEIWNISDNWFQEKVLPGREERSVEALVWCHDRLLSAGLHGFVQEHDLRTFQIKERLSANNGAVWCLEINADRTKVAAGTEEGCVVIFDVSDGGLEFHRSLNRQEGRILSLAWHEPEQVIVTGGIDNLRVWSLKSGQAIHRLTPGRLASRSETLVWAVAITGDFTIVSGDSRGKVCFWNGRQGTQISSFVCNAADVLCLCLTPDGSSVFASGVEPLVTQFEFVAVQANSEWKRWVKTNVRSQHTHDVRALACANESLISAGVDTRLIVNSLDRGSQPSRKIQAFPHRPIASVATAERLMMLRYSEHLDVWRLGRTNANSESDGEILPLRQKCKKLLELKSQGSEQIVCAALSPCGRWIAYSDSFKLRVYRLTVIDQESGMTSVSLNRVATLPAEVLPAHLLCFAPDGEHLVSVSCLSSLQVVRLDEELPSLLHTLPLPSEDSVHLLSVSADGKHVVCADHSSHISVYSLDTYHLVCSLPKYSSQPTALAFHPVKPLLAVVYADHMICEFDLERKEYTEWSRQFRLQVPAQWQRRSGVMQQLFYDSRHGDQLWLRDNNVLCAIDKTQRMPRQKENIFKSKSSKSTKESRTKVDHCFHVCNKYLYLLHAELAADGELVVVERTPSALIDTLPQTLKVKKFGT